MSKTDCDLVRFGVCCSSVGGVGFGCAGEDSGAVQRGRRDFVFVLSVGDGVRGVVVDGWIGLGV